MKRLIFIFIYCIILGDITGAVNSASGDGNTKSDLVNTFLQNRRKTEKKGAGVDKITPSHGIMEHTHEQHAGVDKITPSHGIMEHTHEQHAAPNNILREIEKKRGLTRSAGIPQHAPNPSFSGAMSPASMPFTSHPQPGIPQHAPNPSFSGAMSPVSMPFTSHAQPAPSYGSQYNLNSPSSSHYGPSPSSYNFGSSYGFGRENKKNADVTHKCSVGGRQIFVGDTWSITGICALFTCQENHFRTVTSQCPPLKYQEKYKCEVLMQDMSQDYPGCCPKLSCSTTQPQQENSNKERKKSGGYSSQNLFGTPSSSFSF